MPNALDPLESPAASAFGIASGAGRRSRINSRTFMTASAPVISVVVARPLYRRFDYRLPAGMSVSPGQRVRVPFGRREVPALVLDLDVTPPAGVTLKPVTDTLDDWPVVPESTLALMRWAANYYQHPLGECLFASLPPPLRSFTSVESAREQRWQVIGELPSHTRRAPRQKALLDWLQDQGAATTAAIIDAGFSRAVLKALQQKNAIACTASTATEIAPVRRERLLALNTQQAAVFERVRETRGFMCHLLYGVTGSGKTEVYLHYLADRLSDGDQALVMVPEINLTPQMLDRFRRVFGDRVAAWHSALNNSQRTRTWLKVREGEPLILVGTRSAVLLPFVKLATVIVDEEHDSSYKQHEGFRYSGRDLAVYRARMENCPVILGSATPSLESLLNVERGRYQLHRLPGRAQASPPQIELLDIRSRHLEAGLSQPLLTAMEQHLGRGNQVLVFINRRGFAPVMMCFDCGHIMECPRCDSRLAFHSSDQSLRCHHCEYRTRVVQRCPKCSTGTLYPVGQGTEQAEDYLQRRFPAYPVVRVDRDSTRRKGSMDRILQQVRGGEPCILIGTQMLAKGHDFPGITLAVVVNADGSLFSIDFRAPEQLLQTLVQVAGRAGRGEQPGKVIIQTCHAEHPLLQQLAGRDYLTLARELLAERVQAGLPPGSAMAVIRADARTMAEAIAWLEDLRRQMGGDSTPGLQVQGPLPAVMARRADRYRAQLVLQSPQRGPINHFLRRVTEHLDQSGARSGVRWTIDVDPLEVA